MKSIYEWLFEIEDKILMYIGTYSLEILRAYISGYETALINNKLIPSDDFYPGFQRYVEDCYETVFNEKGWQRLIQERSGSEKEAMRKFYELLHAFYENMHGKHVI